MVFSLSLVGVCLPMVINRFGGQIKTSVSIFGGVCCQYREE